MLVSSNPDGNTGAKHVGCVQCSTWSRRPLFSYSSKGWSSLFISEFFIIIPTVATHHFSSWQTPQSSTSYRLSATSEASLAPREVSNASCQTRIGGLARAKCTAGDALKTQKNVRTSSVSTGHRSLPLHVLSHDAASRNGPAPRQ